MFKGISQRLMYTFLGIALVAGLSTAYANVTVWNVDKAPGSGFTAEEWNNLVDDMAPLLEEVNDWQAAGTAVTSRIDYLWHEMFFSPSVGPSGAWLNGTDIGTGGGGGTSRIDVLETNVANLMIPSVSDPNKVIFCQSFQRGGMNSNGKHSWGEFDHPDDNVCEVNGCINLQGQCVTGIVNDIANKPAGFKREDGIADALDISSSQMNLYPIHVDPNPDFWHGDTLEVVLFCPNGYRAISGGFSNKDNPEITASRYGRDDKGNWGWYLRKNGADGFSGFSLVCERF